MAYVLDVVTNRQYKIAFYNLYLVDKDTHLNLHNQVY